MARSVTSVAAGRVNARFLLLAFLLAVISGVLVYAGLSRSGGDGGSSAVAIDVVVAQQPIAVGQRITADTLSIRQLPVDAVGEGPLNSTDDVVGKQALVPIAAGEPVLSAKIVGSGTVATEDAIAFVVEAGQRGMAINVDRVVSAGGLVLPGDHVDVYWVPDDRSTLKADHQGALLIAENVEVLAVQQTLVGIGPTASGVTDDTTNDAGTTGAGSERVRDPSATAEPDATTLTLLLNPTQSARIFCAEAAGRLRLTVRGFGDETPTGQQQATCVIPAGADQSANQGA
ncbi:MAG: Flp pilus assembly protein CpaB [Dehalococcoidia bacterium]